MQSTPSKTCAVIGSGVAGLAAAIRMQNKGYQTTIFEANAFPGGKLSTESLNGYRFDMGPSVFTMPHFADELFELSGKNPRDYFNYERLDPVYRYFFEDGTVLDGFNGMDQYAKEMASKTNDDEDTVLNYLKKTERMYNLTDEVFLHNSLHRAKNYFTKAVVKGLLNFGKIGAFSSMHNANNREFKDKRLVQVFNRYATYNGSNPYVAPATLNVISHVEIDRGAFYPEGGMHSITKALVQLAKDIGIEFRFSNQVNQIIVEQKTAKGIVTANGKEMFDCVVSNMDVYNTYHKLIPEVKKPLKTLNQPKSSSGIIFYWGIKKQFPELNLHNILFAEDYEAEFNAMFETKTPYHDPTIYINITAKHTPTDAPEGCENWFSFVNVPNNQGQDWDAFIDEVREAVIQKVNRILKTDIRPLIDCEMVFDPRVIENRTRSAFGAIYGNSSNNKFAAFLRHPNFSKKIKNLYFCGGSVHPGPSIPLCLLSAKIATDSVEN
jgi:phytoene desaturase